MRWLIFLIPLLSMAQEIHLFGTPVLIFNKGDSSVQCSSTGVYDYLWEPCVNYFPAVRCEGHPHENGKRFWECTFKYTHGYEMTTEVLKDYKTLKVIMTPVWDIHPALYVTYYLCTCIFVVCVCVCGYYSQHANIILAAALGASFGASLVDSGVARRSFFNVS